jgi:hypothetical protein
MGGHPSKVLWKGRGDCPISGEISDPGLMFTVAIGR